MAVLNLMFEFADESRLDETALTIQERLSGIDVVNEVEAIPEESSRFSLDELSEEQYQQLAEEEV